MPITTADGWFGAAKQKILMMKTSAIGTYVRTAFQPLEHKR